MNRKPFHFKQFKVYHDKCAMKVGTDGVLLGAWTELNQPKRILDIGTGTGVIAIMLAQRTDGKAIIDAIDIDESAYQQSTENINNCPWKEKLKAHHTSLQTYQSDHKYDLIISNPPFFQKSTKSESVQRDLARHTESLSFSELVNRSFELLSESGIISVILPTIEGKEFIHIAASTGLHFIKKTTVRPKAESLVERLLLSFAKQPRPLEEDDLIIQFEKRNDYTPEYIALTKEFYSIM